MITIPKGMKEELKERGRVYLVDRRNHKSVELGNIIDVLLGGEICTDLGYEIVISDKYKMPIGALFLQEWSKNADKQFGLLSVKDEK